MSNRQMSADQFLSDVAEHKMTVRFDTGLYRNLRFRQPDNSNQWFEIATWPGSLVINGDMGTWSFSRVDDMFTFFRSDALKINAHYWQEKATSESRFGGPSSAFDADTFKTNVLSCLDGYDLDEKQRAEIVGALDEEVFGMDEELFARQALDSFQHDDPDYEPFSFSDPWEIDGMAYTYHFLWCLYAIVWAIQQYDAMKAEVDQ